MGILILLLSACIMLHAPTVSTSSQNSKAPLLLVSFDGFRWDYLNRTTTPNFDKFILEGSRARYMKNAFATKTFPNHYSIATGLYEESHGILANRFYDPVMNKNFTPNLKNPEGWYLGDPIWSTNQNAGGNRFSSCYFWVGCQANISGQMPYWNHLPYERSVPLRQRIDATVRDLTDPSRPANLALLYYHEPDWTGHEYGPDSPQIADVVSQLDEAVGYLILRLKQASLWPDAINVILTSDHGMASVSRDRTVTLARYISPDYYTFYDNSPVVHVWPSPAARTRNMSEYLIRNITNALENVPHISVYTKDTIPSEYHYNNSVRAPPVLLVADDRWEIEEYRDSRSEKGTHGYNNSFQDMHPYFLAHGPSFLPGASFDHLDNVDIYPLACHLLGLSPSPNNGSLARVRPVLRHPPPLHVLHAPLLPPAVIGMLVAAATLATLAFVLCVVRSQRYLINTEPSAYRLYSPFDVVGGSGVPPSVHYLGVAGGPSGGEQTQLLLDEEESDSVSVSVG